MHALSNSHLGVGAIDLIYRGDNKPPIRLREVVVNTVGINSNVLTYNIDKVIGQLS